MFSKILSVAAYLFSLPGILAAVLLGGKDRFCRGHARRSLELFLFMAVLFGLWFVLTCFLLFIPYAGFVLAALLFGIVAAGFVFSAVMAVTGAVKALRGKEAAFPFISAFMARLEPLFVRLGLGAEQPQR
jgi:uncharacterized membrane protein